MTVGWSGAGLKRKLFQKFRVPWSRRPHNTRRKCTWHVCFGAFRWLPYELGMLLEHATEMNTMPYPSTSEKIAGPCGWDRVCGFSNGDLLT